MSVAFSTLNYIVYIPELVLVRWYNLNHSSLHSKLAFKVSLKNILNHQKISGKAPFLTKGPIALFFGGRCCFYTFGQPFFLRTFLALSFNILHSEGLDVISEESSDMRPINYTLNGSIVIFLLLHIRWIYPLLRPNFICVSQPDGVQESETEARHRLRAAAETAESSRLDQPFQAGLHNNHHGCRPQLPHSPPFPHGKQHPSKSCQLKWRLWYEKE